MQCGFILAMQIFMWAREKQDQREETGFGCDTAFGAWDVDLLLALLEIALVTLAQPCSPLHPQLPTH